MAVENAGEDSRLALPFEPLTEREQTILRFIGEGLSDREIAQALSVALDTVKWYNKRIYVKLDVRNRTQATSRAKALGLFDRTDQTERPDTATVIPHQPRNNLPAQVSSFIGRRREVTAVQQVLQKSRLLTLTGIGGAGKTRLALQVAKDMLPEFSDGVWFVPLAPVLTTDNILWVVAERLNFQFNVSSEPTAQLLAYLHAKNLLLVLDNFEHLIAGAALITEMLEAAPGVKILVTSRERLNLYGEVTYPVAGMALPTHKSDITQSEAVQLFMERAQSVSPNLDWNSDTLQPIERICRLVDGMPLGIELAATWMDTLSPQEIAEEIEHSLDVLEVKRQDIPERQRSIRAAFERSWQLLDETQQIAFRRLSVFQGGFTREAGEAITSVGLRTLQALVYKSLVRRNPNTGRYEFHELLRHYAAEQLEASGEAEQLYQAHAIYFANFMAERWPRMKDFRQKTAVEEVEADIENARAAWQYWIRTGNIIRLNMFLHTLWAVYDIRGWYLAGIDLFEQGIQVMRASGTEEARAGLGWLLAVQGLYSVTGEVYKRSSMPAPSWLTEYRIYVVSGDAKHGYALAKEGVEILKQLKNWEDMMILPLISLFITSCLLDEQGVPLQTAQECLEIASRTGDEWAIAKAKLLLAVKAIGDGDYPQAAQLAQEALSTFETNGDNWSKSTLCTEVLGLLEIRLREFEAARKWIQQGLKAAEEIDFKYAIQTAYWQLGFVATLGENYVEAGRHWSKAFEVADQILGGTTFLGFGGSGVTE